MSFDLSCKVSFEEVCAFLVGSGPPSATGPVLEKVRDGTTGIAGNGKNNTEFTIIAEAGVLGVVDALRNLPKIDFEKCPNLRKFARKTDCGEGALALAVVGAYSSWNLRSEERGLVEVYRLLQKLDGSLKEPEHSQTELSRAFVLGEGTAVQARDLASRLLKDSLIAVDGWINRHNEKVEKSRRRAGRSYNGGTHAKG